MDEVKDIVEEKPKSRFYAATACLLTAASFALSIISAVTTKWSFNEDTGAESGLFAACATRNTDCADLGDAAERKIFICTMYRCSHTEYRFYRIPSLLSVSFSLLLFSLVSLCSSLPFVILFSWCFLGLLFFLFLFIYPSNMNRKISKNENYFVLDLFLF